LIFWNDRLEIFVRSQQPTITLDWIEEELVDFYEMPESEKYEYTYRCLGRFTTTFIHLNQHEIDFSRLKYELAYFHEHAAIWEHYSQKKRNSRYAAILADVRAAVQLCEEEKYRTAYWYGELASAKSMMKPKVFGQDLFVVSTHPKKKHDLIECYPPEMRHIFYGVPRSPWFWARQVSGFLDALRPTCRDPQALDQVDRLFRDSAFHYACGRLDEALYLAFDARDLYLHTVDPEQYPDPKQGLYRQNFTLTIEDLPAIRKLDLMNGWVFAEYPDFESLPHC
jgi:hypothetical protein